jgi:hypothetical protein
MSITPSSSTEYLPGQEPFFKMRKMDEDSDSTSEVQTTELFSQDPLRLIFGFLPFGCLGVVARVCKLWQKAASHVSLLRPYCYPSAEPEDFSVVTVPKELSTLNNLLKWAACKKIKMGTIDRAVLTRFGGQEVNGKWLISNFGAVGTEDLIITDQEDVICSYEYEMQSVVVALALNLFTYLQTGNWLLGDDPITYIRCKNNIILGGATAEHGPNIRIYDAKAPHIYAGAMEPIEDQDLN